MPRMVDILLSPEELAALGKKSTSCMRLDPSSLAPALCVSKTGLSSAAMFGKHHMHSGPGKSQPALADYAKLYEKYYGNGSIMERLVEDNKAKADATRDALVDAEMKKRALHETRAKYLSPRLASLHHVEAPGIVGPPPASAPVLGLTLVHRQQQGPGTGVTSGLGSTQPDPASAKVLEMAQQLLQAQAAREAAAEVQAAKRALERRRRAAMLNRGPTQETSSFRAATRDQRSRTGSKFVEGGQSAPGPGKYEVRWTYWDAKKPNLKIVPPCYAAEQRSLLAQKARRAADQEARAEARSPSGRSQRPSTAGSQRLSGGGGQLQLQPESSSRPATARSHCQTDAHASRHRPMSAPPGRGHRGKGPSAREAAQTLFKDAHHVHSHTHVRPGSSSFKAPTRPMLNLETAASHLALKYYRDDIDSSTRKARHLVTSFDGQTSRKPPSTGADTPIALGPGAYATPVTFSGRHVAAGHVGLRGAADFARMAPRPYSAQLPDAQPIPDVSSQEATAALQALFGEQLNPTDLLSIEHLQLQGGVDPQYQPPGQRKRPTSAVVHSSQGPIHGHTRPYSALPAARAAAVVHAITDHTALTERPPPGAAEGPHGGGAQPLSHEALERFSSTGLSGRVKGGHFARTTRAQEIQGLRVVADGKVIPPASAPLSKIRPGQAADVIYDPVPDTVQGHRPRTPSWQLPPNRAALSKQWVSAAALAYI